MKAVAAVLALLLVATACDGEEEAPQETVDAWLAAVAAADLVALDELVVPGHEALVAVTEAGGGDDVVAVLEGGLSDEDRAEFWATFAEGFAAEAGGPIGDMAARGVRSFVVGDEGFRVIDIRSDDATGLVILRRVEGAWRVDLIATVLPPLVRPLRQVVDGLGEQRPGALATAGPSLQAGLDHGVGQALAQEFRDDLQALVLDLGAGG